MVWGKICVRIKYISESTPKYYFVVLPQIDHRIDKEAHPILDVPRA
jgi:hypothetical protein